MKRCVLSLERNIGREDEFRVSGGSEFQSRGPMTEKALLPSDDRTYGMEYSAEHSPIKRYTSGWKKISQHLDKLYIFGYFLMK